MGRPFANPLRLIPRVLVVLLAWSPVLLRAAPGDPSSWENERDLGLACFHQRDWDSAIAHFTEALRLNPRDARVYDRRALAREYTGDPAGAIADFRMAVNLNPRSAEPYVHCGRLLQYERHEPGIAIADYTEAIRLEPTNVETVILRARAYLAQKDFTKAVNDCNTAIQLQPANAAFYADRARAREAAGRNWAKLGVPSKMNEALSQAVNDWREAASLEADYLWDLGEVESRNGQPAAAIGDLTQYLQTHPGSHAGWQSRARACERKAREDAKRGDQTDQQAALDQALADWNQLVASDSGRETPFLCERGDFYARNHQFAKALADYQRAVELQPLNNDALNSLGMFLATCPDETYRDGPQAVADTEKAYAAGSHDSVFNLAALAAAYAETQSYAEAVKFQKLALQALETTGQILETAGLPQPDSLRSELQERLALYEWNRPCHQILGLGD
jgi:tetratricopeptide (TPR) repeat protein